jgi:O-antigen ligase
MVAHPLFGVGLGQFQAVEHHYNPMLASFEANTHVAHNTYVQLGAEGGIPTLLMYLAILAMALSTCRSAQNLPGVSEDIATFALALRIGLIGIMVAEFFLTAEYIKEVWVFISLAPNLYAISLLAAEAVSEGSSSRKTAPVEPIVLRPRLRTG